MELEDIFLQFLRFYCPEKPPLLLGLSGGPDSIALFYLLKKMHYPFEVAHIDHGWRQESAHECEILSNLCAAENIIFHTKKLLPPSKQKNLEDLARKARLDFFKKILEIQNLQGVFLAHHADDHAETVLKRLFEGASLHKLKGLLPKTEISGLTLYRPFLKIRKKQILKWLEEKNIEFFLDRTNADPKFLRTRLRHELIPHLSKHFGKEITFNLCRLGETAAELEEFLEEATAPYLHDTQNSVEGACLRFKEPLKSDFLWKMVLRAFFDLHSVSISYSFLETVLLHLKRESCHKSLQIGKQAILIHRNQLFIKKKCVE